MAKSLQRSFYKKEVLAAIKKVSLACMHLPNRSSSNRFKKRDALEKITAP
jgi:hypothetical protein